MRLLVVALVCSSSLAAAQKAGDKVVVKAGSKLYGNAGDHVDRGRVVRARSWTVKAVEDEWITVERKANGIVETITVKQDAIGGTEDTATTQLVAASAGDCTQRGLCNFALRAGKRLDEHMVDTSTIAVTKRIVFHRAIKVCRLGPLIRIEIDAKDTDWMAPATIEPTLALGYSYELATTLETLAGTKPATPPACPAKPNANKVVVGGSNKRPQMGLFALSKEDGRSVGAKFGNLREAYELAGKLAKKSWAGDRTFCEDAVRQSLRFVGGTLDAAERKRWRSGTLADVKRTHWDQIVVRHAWMIEEYAPDVCAKTLATYVEALRYAATHDLELANFGY